MHKILFVNHSVFGIQGTAAGMYYPVTLSKLGYAVGVICPGGKPEWCKSNMNLQFFDWDEANNHFTRCRKLGALINDFKPDIVHVFFDRGVGVYPLFCRNKRTKFVLDIRSPLTAIGIKRLVRQLSGPLECVFYDKVLAHNVQCGKSVVGRYVRINYAPPGVDIGLFSEDNNKMYNYTTQSNKELKLVYIGSLHKKRQLEILIEGLIIALEKANFTVDFYGSGDDSERLHKLVKDAKVSNYIKFHGYKTQNELAKCLYKYDIGLGFVPHGMYEFAPALKTLEYMAAGLPVLATNTEGNLLFVKDGHNGMLVECNEKSIAKGIVELCICNKKAIMSQEAKKVAEQYSWHNVVNSYIIPVYHELLAKS